MKLQKKSELICILSALGLSLASCADPVTPQSCEDSSDCEDEQQICREGICIDDPCKDTLLSEGESDIDCGHVCRKLCSVNMRCFADEDCETGTCNEGICIDPEGGCTSAETGELLMTEILNNVNTGKPFENISATQTEFFEIYNNSDKKIALSPISIQCTRTDDGNDKTVLFEMKGCVEPHNAILVTNSAVTDLPEGVINVATLPGTGQLTNTASYSCILVQSTINANGGKVQTPIHSVTIDSSATAGVSEVLDPVKYTTAPRAMKLHTEVSPSGAKHSPGYCTNGALFINECQSLCENGKTDPGESDVDCGGNLCTPCANGLKCSANDDCLSKLCTDGVCAAQSCTVSGCADGFKCDAESGECYSCSDGIQNGLETGVDCGGMECGRCGEGMGCRDDNDCESMSCRNAQCYGPKIDCQTAQAGDILLTEVLNNAASSKDMATFEAGTGQKQVEFFELYNRSDHAVSLDDLTIDLARVDKSGSASFALRGCLKSGQAAVISGSAISGLPKGVSNLVIDSMPANSLTNTATYRYELTSKDGLIHTVHDSAASQEGISRVISSIENTDNEELSNHNDLNSALKHSPGYCTNGALYENACEILCENGKIDDGETDVDCGGSCEAKCGVDQACQYNSDCESNVCTNQVCAKPKCTDDTICPNGWCNKETGECESCSDGKKDGLETDVDCGGVICGACDAGKICQAKIDCLSYNCENFVCVGDPVESIKAEEILINEVMGAPKTGENFSTQPETAQCEFVEIVSIAEVYRNLNGWSLMYQKSGTETASSVPLSNLIEPKHGIVLHNCSALPLPANMREQTLEPKLFTNSADYDFWLSDGKESTEHVTRKSIAVASGISQTRAVDLDPGAELVFHNKVNAQYKNSPGYCSNGGLFTENCLTTCSNGEKDNDETDVDCGGSCTGCDLGKACSTEKDCTSGYCTNGVCVKPPCKANDDCEDGMTCDLGTGICISCSDNVKNGDETDVDCGGSCGGCAAGKACTTYQDCASGICESKACVGSDAAMANPEDLLINEILDTSSKSPVFALNDGVTACEFIEIANPTDKALNLMGLNLVLNAVNDSNVAQKAVTIPLHGVLNSKNLLVVHNCTQLPLPDDAVSFKVDTDKLLTGTWIYTITLEKNDQKSEQISSLALESAYNTSYNRNPDMTANASMTKTTSITGYAAYATPGYCLNGALYSDGCKVQCENGRKDKDETDIDCGGSCGGCGNDKYCTQNSDCLSELCAGGRCTGEIPVTPEPAELVINEVMASKGTSKVFSMNNNVSTCEFIEVVNTTTKKLSLNGVKISLNQITSTTKSKEVVLSGSLPSKGVLVAHNCDSLPLPTGVVTAKIDSNFMTDTATFEFWIDVNGKAGTHSTVPKATSGVSKNRANDLDSTTVIGTNHTAINKKAVASPGYCANGNLFSNNCK